MRGWKTWLLLGVIALGTLAVTVELRKPYAYLAAQRCRRQLNTVPDSRAAALVAQAAALGEPGIPVLVEALGSKRKSVARAGKTALIKQLGRWKKLNTQTASSRLAVLADALATDVENFDSTAQSDAAHFATRILSWPLDAETVDPARVILSCEKVLRAAATRGDVPPRQGVADWERLPVELADVPSPLLPTADRLRAERPGPTDASIPELSRLPGGGLPIDLSSPADEVRDQQLGESARVSDARSTPPGHLVGMPDAKPISPAGGSRRPVAAPGAMRPRPEDTSDEGAMASRKPSVRSLSLERPVNLARLESTELLQRLHGEDRAKSNGVAAELSRRGFSPKQIALGRQLFDPDPEVRKRLARSLPGQPGIDAAAWLKFLCRDDDAEVRLAAITLLATTADPALIDHALQLAREDSDPRIRRQAERLARPQRR